MATSINCTVGESSRTVGNTANKKVDKIYEPLDINVKPFLPECASGSGANALYTGIEFQMDTVEVKYNVQEHQFIPNLISTSPSHLAEEDNLEKKNLSALINSEDDLCVSLHLGDGEPEKQCTGQHI